jgi:predicted polyphosphate/ATP-dependent NAD kinase
MAADAKKLGFIVNPVAGLGGRVGLKGSDGLLVQRKALALGAVPHAQDRAVEALERLHRLGGIEIVTWAGRMGERAARSCGFSPTVAGAAASENSTADDTRAAASAMRELGADLLLFAGGDGTARDICAAVGEDLPALGIPAGVKIHSAVYATNPLNAGELAALFLGGRVSALRAAEVMDIDEEAVREGRISASLYGYLRVPLRTSLVQSLKAASGPGEEAAMDAIAAAVVESMGRETLYLVGPGTTTRAILSRLGLQKTLIGVDAVLGGKLVASDLNENQILALIENHAAGKVKIVVTPVGGQGCIFGRGNQQLSPEVLARVGRANVIVVSTREKLDALATGSLWVDTGDHDVDAMLAGHMRVITAYKEEAVCRVEG